MIDASGDLDVAARAGEDFELAGANDNPVQSLTTIFYIANVDNQKAFSLTQVERTRIMQKAGKSGNYKLTRIGGSIHPTPSLGFGACQFDQSTQRGRHGPAGSDRCRDRGAQAGPGVHAVLKE